MDKAFLLSELKQRLSAELRTARAAAAEAAEGATHAEAKPENQYDTRGLEQSYLAGAQAARAEVLAVSMRSLEGYTPPGPGPGGRAVLGSAVRVDGPQGVRGYFLLDVGGGTKISAGEETWWVLSPLSPLGQRLLGCRPGDEFEHRGAQLEVLEVL